uniref:RNA polymerase II subunit A C-terminal domain phosphatase SSU72 n=1 Tax=Myotis lucifugus TaxID=59463 RepID=G1QDJ1_MYOLU
SKGCPESLAVINNIIPGRGMEVHNFLRLRVCSFGSGTHTRLPGLALDKPNVYDFKTTYNQMYNGLLRKGTELCMQNGILHIWDRSKRIKLQSERFLNCKRLLDLILTCKESVDQVAEDLNSREQGTCQLVHMANVDIQGVATQGLLACELCQDLRHTEDMENEMQLLQEFQEKGQRPGPETAVLR